jgi:hypothetical protein
MVRSQARPGLRSTRPANGWWQCTSFRTTSALRRESATSPATASVRCVRLQTEAASTHFVVPHVAPSPTESHSAARSPRQQVQPRQGVASHDCAFGPAVLLLPRSRQRILPCQHNLIWFPRTRHCYTRHCCTCHCCTRHCCTRHCYRTARSLKCAPKRRKGVAIRARRLTARESL